MPCETYPGTTVEASYFFGGNVQTFAGEIFMLQNINMSQENWRGGAKKKFWLDFFKTGKNTCRNFFGWIFLKMAKTLMVEWVGSRRDCLAGNPAHIRLFHPAPLPSFSFVNLEKEAL